MSEPPDDDRDPQSMLRSVERRLRRDKLGLERLNPLERPEEYEAALDHVLDLEVRRRELRALVRASDDPIVLPDEDDDHDGDDDSDDVSDLWEDASDADASDDGWAPDEPADV